MAVAANHRPIIRPLYLGGATLDTKEIPIGESSSSAKFKGLMMGLWFAATAIGNYLSSIPSMLWNNVPLWVNWTVLMALCVISGLVMFSMLRKLEAATA